MAIRWLKRGLLLLAIVGIAAVIVWALVPKPIPVEVATTGRGPLRVTIDDDGRARVASRHVVAAPLAGALARIELKPGDTLAASDVIARIVPLPAPLIDQRTRVELEGRYQIALANTRLADASVTRARVASEHATRELDRTRELVASHAASDAELAAKKLAADIGQRDVVAARFAATVAKHESATAESMLARYDAPPTEGSEDEVAVRAPVDGVVLRVIAESEGVVAPGTPLVEVGDPSRLEIVAELLTTDAVAITSGAEVAIVGWGGPELAGRVRLVEPSARTRVSALGVEEQRVAVVIDLVDPPERWTGLGDGWRVEVRVTTWRSADVLLIPLGALFRDGERWATYVLEDEHVVLRALDVGHRGSAFAEVLSGLTPGEEVIIHPSERVLPGGRARASR